MKPEDHLKALLARLNTLAVPPMFMAGAAIGAVVQLEACSKSEHLDPQEFERRVAEMARANGVKFQLGS